MSSPTPGADADGGGAGLDFSDRLRQARAQVARIGGLAAAVVILALIFSYRTDGQMLDVDNLLGIVRAVSTITIMSLGLLVVIVAGEIDLSFANLYGLCTNVVAVLWLTHGVPVYLSIAAAFGVAIAVGCFNAFFTAVVGIPSFIATLGSSTLIFGFTLYIGYAQSFSAQYPPTGHTVPHSEYGFFTNLSNAHLPGKFPMQGVWMVVLLVIFGFLLGRSLFGFRLKAIGGNRQAAALAGCPCASTSSSPSSCAPACRAWPASSTSRSSARPARTTASRTCSRCSPR